MFGLGLVAWTYFLVCYLLCSVCILFILVFVIVYGVDLDCWIC